MKYIIFDGIDINNLINNKEIDYIKQKITIFFYKNFNISLENYSIEIDDINSSSICIYIFLNSEIFYKLIINYQGEIIEFQKIQKINRRKIDDLCELESFPIYLNNNYIVKIKGSSNIVLNDKNLNIYRHLVIKPYLDKYEFNTPLFYENKKHFDSENDSYIRFPYYDKEDKFAIVLNRYSNGLNLCVAFVNIKKNSIQQGPVIYYKNAIAIEKLDEKYLRIYISYNDEIINYIYPEKDEDTSGWYFINIKDEFEKI